MGFTSHSFSDLWAPYRPLPSHWPGQRPTTGPGTRQSQPVRAAGAKGEAKSGLANRTAERLMVSPPNDADFITVTGTATGDR